MTAIMYRLFGGDQDGRVIVLPHDTDLVRMPRLAPRSLAAWVAGDTLPVPTMEVLEYRVRKVDPDGVRYAYLDAPAPAASTPPRCTAYSPSLDLHCGLREAHPGQHATACEGRLYRWTLRPNGTTASHSTHARERTLDAPLSNLNLRATAAGFLALDHATMGRERAADDWRAAAGALRKAHDALQAILEAVEDMDGAVGVKIVAAAAYPHLAGLR